MSEKKPRFFGHSASHTSILLFSWILVSERRSELFPGPDTTNKQASQHRPYSKNHLRYLNSRRRIPLVCYQLPLVAESCILNDVHTDSVPQPQLNAMLSWIVQSFIHAHRANKPKGKSTTANVQKKKKKKPDRSNDVRIIRSDGETLWLRAEQNSWERDGGCESCDGSCGGVCDSECWVCSRSG